MRIELAAQRAQLRFAGEHAQLQRAAFRLRGALECRQHVVAEHGDEQADGAGEQQQDDEAGTRVDSVVRDARARCCEQPLPAERRGNPDGE